MTFPRLRVAAAAALALAAAALPSAAADDPAPDSYWVYFGTYTGKESKGIYRSKLDVATGKLSPAELAAEVASPSFVNVHPSQKYLYAVGEAGGKEGGGVHAYAIDAKTGALTKLNEGTSGGGGPCHVAVNAAGTHAVVANYGGGSTAVFKLGADGKLGDRTAFVQHKGNSTDKGRQEAPHAHFGAFSPGGEYALTVDLGLDRIKVFKFDPATGKVDDDAAADVTTPAGSGPRHLAIAPAGDFGYVCGELNSTVNVVKFDWKGGKHEVIQTLSTLPEPVKGNSTAECILHPNGKFVYVSNRGHNSVAVFAVGEDKKLTAAGRITGDIKIPRNFNIDPTGRWMLIASQDGDKIGVYDLDPKTGLAKETGESVKVGMPVCVKFVAVVK